MPASSSRLQQDILPVSVAPMMAYTDRHFRYFLRLLSPSALLYTEMIATQALKHGEPRRWLTFSPQEHPLALQLGGSDPGDLAEAAKLGAQFGYDQINLNCGCPSDRVKSGRFGACLMAEPERVAASVKAMRAAVHVPVTVKCRIGIEPRDAAGEDYAFLADFVGQIAAAGCSVFVVHARKAVLGGMSPKENREIPPLQYATVQRLKRDFPQAGFVLNGGIRTVADVRRHLEVFDGVMLGREVCENPYILTELHRAVAEPEWVPPSRETVIEEYAHYVEERLREGYPLRSMTRHVLGLYAGLPRSRSWRRYLSEQGAERQAGPQMLIDSLRIVRAA